jgi:hypothetical protein
VEHGHDGLVAASAAEFAEHVRLVAGDPGRADDIGAAGMALVARTYASAIVRERWRTILDALSPRADQAAA